MSEATAPLPVLEAPQTLEELVAAQNVLLERNAAEMAALKRQIRAAAMSQGELTELVIAVNRITDVEKVMLDVAALIRQAAVLRTVEQAREALRPALAPVPGPQPARHRHRRTRRVPGEGQQALFPVRGLVPVAAAAWAALKHALRHGAAAKMITVPSAKAAAIAAAGTAAVAAAGAVAVVTLAPSHAGAPASAGAGIPVPAASIEAAMPFPSGTPAAVLVTRPKAKHPGRKAALSGTGVLVAPPVTQPSSPAPSSPSSSSGPSSPAGTLTADVMQFSLPDAGGNYGGTVNLTVTGGTVDWHAVPSSPALVLGARTGTVAPGDPPYGLTFTIDPSALAVAGSAWITIYPADIRVLVTWAALPLPSGTPGPVPSGIPSPAAS